MLNNPTGKSLVPGEVVTKDIFSVSRFSNAQVALPERLLFSNEAIILNKRSDDIVERI
jgi:hypothetical protein